MVVKRLSNRGGYRPLGRLSIECLDTHEKGFVDRIKPRHMRLVANANGLDRLGISGRSTRTILGEMDWSRLVTRSETDWIDQGCCQYASGDQF